MKTIQTLLLASAFVVSAAAVPASAQATMDHSKMAATGTAAAGAADLSDGEVRKIDKDQGKITLKHGPIRNLDMPGMTMVFAVKDKALLDTVKSGDKVKFRAADENGKYTVTEIMPAK